MNDPKQGKEIFEEIFSKHFYDYLHILIVTIFFSVIDFNVECKLIFFRVRRKQNNVQILGSPYPFRNEPESPAFNGQVARPVPSGAALGHRLPASRGAHVDRPGEGSWSSGHA